MANTLKPYLDVVRSTLESAMCLQNFASQEVERHNKPEVEWQKNAELLLNPVVINRTVYTRQTPKGAETFAERCLIEGSVNSVRVSVAIRKADDLDVILSKRFFHFLTQRAENFIILRRTAVPGYDISFLITNAHTETMYKHKVVDFVIQFIQDIDQEISDMKLSVSARARIVASEFLKEFK
eukprot:TRINITY_DN11154_c0_g1_i1.p1 TRINITY_DN11154_c0_g1~~TRINITY_DN11154_c0_g1_i1.p1  ORF type:complete len:182 (-),score=38.99 TRINITY_DN11154_c0_g1_i1:60-605(-)